MYNSQKLAEKIVSAKDVPASALEAASRCILDAVTAAVASQNSPGTVSAQNGAVAAFGRGDVPIWLTNLRTTALGATFANAAASSMLDIDDGHRAAAGHPGASIVPAVISAVYDDPALAPRAFAAVAIGYETGIRIAASRDLRTLDTVDTGRWCGQAAAAAVGWLRQMPASVIAEAIASAGTIAPMIATANFTQVGNHVKEAIPQATANGLIGLHMAQAGFAAPLDILDDSRFFDGQRLLDGWGEWWLIETTYFKPYSCCRFLHASIDGLLKIMGDNRLSHRDLKKIHVETIDRTMKLPNQVTPKSLQHAQYSVPFCLGVTAVHGAKALLPMTDEGLLDDKDVLSVSSMVDLLFDAELDSYFSAAVPSRITVSTENATFTETVMAPLGEPTNPMNWDALFEKFHALSSGLLPPTQEAGLRSALDVMREGDISPLLTELARPVATRQAPARQLA